ncbi:MAG: ribokinase [Desulfurococcales archaeon ex4484_58]|nr:MAG: ribokinase [Desulfurococcales archaeon ex4484_58]
MNREKPLHVAVGNLNIDITLYVDKIPRYDESVLSSETLISPGGSATNYSIAVRYYGHRVSLIASTSTNPLVDNILKQLRDHGITTDYIKRVDEEPGLVIVIVLKNGERLLFKYRGANELLSPNDLPRELMEQANIIHLTSIPPNIVDEIVSRASRLGVLISYDPGVYVSIYREKILEIIDNINILFLNRVEAKELSRGRIEDLLKYNIDAIVVKKGAGGAYLLQHGGKYYYGISKPLQKPVNTTGAGDAFAAFFNAAYLDYRDWGKALRYALAAGALKTMCKTSIICWDQKLFNKQLRNTTIEIVKNPEEWILED